jgi:hydroxyethylthiazole kinase-like uncharacterized protein yjeF
MKALTAAEMREVDRLTTERHGISSYQLMETAGTLAANAFAELMRDAGLEPPHEICVLCGKGNNGGDGFVVARHLRSAAANVFVVLFAREEELKGDSATNFSRWREIGGEVVFVADEAAWGEIAAQVLASDVIVDAMFGTGFRGVASGAIGRAIADVNKKSKDATAVSPALILAVDTPSGLPSDGEPGEEPILKAHHTVTFTAPKVGQLISRNSSAVGSLRVVNIGSPAALVEEIGKSAVRWSDAGEFADVPLVRKSDGNKGMYGNVLIVAGSLGKSGAAVMSGSAALWSGAGLVTVATPDVVLPIVAAAHPEYMTESLFSTDKGTISKRNLLDHPPPPKTASEEEIANFTKNFKIPFMRIQDGKTVLAIGPGLGQHSETQEFVRTTVRSTSLPTILDADGLNAFAGRASEWKDHAAPMMVLTPHPGEFARLLGCEVAEVQNDRLKLARQAAAEWNLHVILKGNQTVIAAPDGHAWINLTGNPGMATGGTGDVLTGMLAGLVAQFGEKNWEGALCMGVYLHGLAGDIAAEAKGEAPLIATDVIEAIAPAYRRTLSIANRVG